jgi:uncharacterized protein YjiK
MFIQLLTFFCCAIFNNRELKHYQLDKPTTVFELPDSLREISGIAFINDSTVACVQDENGILFIYDLQNNVIRECHLFHADGDYEGIAIANNLIYILRSDGKLFEISNYNTGQISSKSYETKVPADNNEGLCYDAANNQLLIGCKNKINDNDAAKNARQIYAFKLDKKELKKQPSYNLSVDDAMQYADKHKMDMSEIGANKKGKNKNTFKFNISAIAIHPRTGNLYILNAADHALFIVNNDEEMVQIALLDPLLFNKPEGISFTPNGDMYITNEGQEGSARILFFEYKNQFKWW